MKIILVTPPFYRGPAWDAEEGPPPNIGIGYIASYLEENGFACDILDASCLSDEQPHDIVNTFNISSYEILGISVYSQTYTIATQIAEASKYANPKQFVVFGGPHATAVGVSILHECPAVDCVVIGEGELTFCDLVKKIDREESPLDIPGIYIRKPDGDISSFAISSSFPHLDSLPPPKRFVLNGGKPFFTYYCPRERVRKKAITLCASRGCPFGCSFCMISSIQRNHNRRSAKSIIEEVQAARNAFHFEHIWFTDPDYLISPDKAIEVGFLLKNIDTSFTWTCTGRADQIVKHKNKIPKLIEAGLTCVEIGIESGCNAVLERWNKGTNVEINMQAIEILKSENLPFEADFIMFDPSSTREELIENILFLKEAGIYGHIPPDAISSEIRLYPATPIREFYAKKWKNTWSPNEIPVYQFEDQEVIDIHNLVHYYENTFSYIFKSLTRVIGNILYSMINTVQYKNHLYPRETIIRLQFLQLAHHVLPTIPYVFFEEVVVNRTITEEKHIPIRISELLGKNIIDYLDKIVAVCTCFEKFIGKT